MKIARNGLRILAFAAVALIVSAGLFAQSKTRAERREEANSRAVLGLVLLPDEMPAVGAVVQLKDTKTKQVRSFYTQDKGDYYFHELSTDIDYELTATFQGASSSTRTLSVFDSRKEARIDLKLNPKK